MKNIFIYFICLSLLMTGCMKSQNNLPVYKNLNYSVNSNIINSNQENQLNNIFLFEIDKIMAYPSSVNILYSVDLERIELSYLTDNSSDEIVNYYKILLANKNWQLISEEKNEVYFNKSDNFYDTLQILVKNKDISGKTQYSLHYTVSSINEKIKQFGEILNNTDNIIELSGYDLDKFPRFPDSTRNRYDFSISEENYQYQSETIIQYSSEANKNNIFDYYKNLLNNWEIIETADKIEFQSSNKENFSIAIDDNVKKDMTGYILEYNYYLSKEEIRQFNLNDFFTEIPGEDFSDLPRYPNSIRYDIFNSLDMSSISYASNDSLSEIKSFYENYFIKNGWNIVNNENDSITININNTNKYTVRFEWNDNYQKTLYYITNFHIIK